MPMTKRQAHRLWHDARRFERQTRQPGHQDGVIGRNGLAVLHVLLFDFLNYRSGDLYPSWAAIAGAANISERSVGRGLVKLKTAGVLNWLRRCVPVVAAAGGFLMRQISNAYAVLPSTQWKGYQAPPEPPKPDPTCWGAQPPYDPVAAAATREGRIEALGLDPSDKLALALARLGSLVISEAASLAMKPDPTFIQAMSKLR
jgi:hypothetical protein